MSMKYNVIWDTDLVQVDYFGETENTDIEAAHCELNADGRFYDCKYLILNVSDCDLSRVSVPDLIKVIARDLGATKVNPSLKVGMITTKPVNVEKVTSYIEKNKSINTPWEFRLFPSVASAQEWFGA